MPSALNVLAGGWQVNGFMRWASGAPFGLSSNRVTTGSLTTSTPVLRNMTARDFQKFVGVFRGPYGVYYIDPNSGLVKVNGATSTAVMCTAGQSTPCFDFPAPGQFGNLGNNFFSGPRFFGQDVSLAKHIRFQERFDIEMRIEMFNVFNTTNFTGISNNITSSTFGQLTSQLDTTRSGGVLARTGQWSVRVSF